MRLDFCFGAVLCLSGEKRNNDLFLQDSSKFQALGLRVSDGRETGNTVFLDLETFKLQIFVVNNTGLVLPMGTSAILSSVNLTYTTNAPDQSINLR